MPRPPRIDFPDAIHHIAALAVEREVVFREPADRRRLIAQLEATVDLYQWRCNAYCLMGTHFHLILQTPEANLSRGMQHLCGAYAQWFNWKYKRRGHLFGRRFASAQIMTDEHLASAHRYVALNPVRAGLCKKPDLWRWGSFRALAGLEKPPAFLDIDGTLSLFGVQKEKARRSFRVFIAQAVPENESLPLARTAGV